MAQHPADPCIERALGLAAGTLRTWEKQGAPPEGKALLLLLQQFPWLVEVADEGFSEQAAKRVLVREGLRAAVCRSGDALRDAEELLRHIVAEGRSGEGNLACAAAAELALDRLAAARAAAEVQKEPP